MGAGASAVIAWAYTRQLMQAIDSRRVKPKRRKAHLCLCLGDNATGKSLFRKIVSAYCGGRKGRPKIEMIGLSMADRAGGMMGIAHAFVYGDEHVNATGVNTGRTVTTAITTAQGRAHPNVVFWDEPDTGLSDAYAADVGRRIADFALNPPAHTRASFVVTHRKALVEQLLRAEPHVLFFGKNAPETVQEYLTAPVKPANIEELYERSHKMFLRVAKILKD